MKALVLSALLQAALVSSRPNVNRRDAAIQQQPDQHDLQPHLQMDLAQIADGDTSANVSSSTMMPATPSAAPSLLLPAATAAAFRPSQSGLSPLLTMAEGLNATSNATLNSTSTSTVTSTSTITAPATQDATMPALASPASSSATLLPGPPSTLTCSDLSTATATATAAPDSTSTSTFLVTLTSTAAMTPSGTTSTVVVMYAGGRDQPTSPADSTTTAIDDDSGEYASPLFSLTQAQSTVTDTTTIATSTYTDIISTSLVTSYVQTTTTLTAEPETSGFVQSTLTTSAPQPFVTDQISIPESSIEPVTAGPGALTNRTGFRLAAADDAAMLSSNIFQPAGTGSLPTNIPQRGGHPVPKTGVNQNGRIPTNKFYANFFLGNRNQGTWTHPYSVAWAKGSGNARSWGLSVSHIERTQLTYGPGNPASYFINPIGIQSVILSASELGPPTALTMDNLGAFHTNVNLAPAAGSAPIVTFPLVQGMGFVTGVYSNGTPLIQSSVFFSNLVYGGLVQGTQTARYQATLSDNTQWLIYLTATGNSQIPTLTLTSNSAIAGSRPFSGSVQVAKNANAQTSLAVYDACAGVYALRGAIAGSANNATGTYRLSWVKGGAIARPLLMFALPHHLDSMPASFSSQSRAALALQTTTKGLARAVVADAWTMTETDLPYDMGFAPWSPTLRSRSTLPASARTLIQSVSSAELSQNLTAQCDLDSMYFSGKGLAKFAMLIYAANDLAGNHGAAAAGLAKLKAEFARFVDNRQINPLVYDTVWGGVVSSCTYRTGDTGCDFGNTLYNDHHFHYGYFVYAAAVIAHLDPAWLLQGSSRQWVDTLVRDYANGAATDAYFPFSRAFDWFHGHSWAHGLYETADGKDQESSSEDAFASYALKLWGRATGDANLEARGNLMLAVTARSLSAYYLLQSDNAVQPPRFIANKAAGILFENKIDHTTYFGGNIEFVEGIHMLPLNPSSALTRPRPFVQQEWAAYFDGGRADRIAGGWRGVLYANLALADPVASWRFFAQDRFDPAWLDGGASRTWYLAMAAALGGVA